MKLNRYTRGAFLRGGVSVTALVFLLGSHSAPMCVTWGDVRTLSTLGTETFTHLSGSC